MLKNTVTMYYVYSRQKVDAYGTLILFLFGQMPSLDVNKITEKNLTMSVPAFMHCNAHTYTQCHEPFTWLGNIAKNVTMMKMFISVNMSTDIKVKSLFLV